MLISLWVCLKLDGNENPYIIPLCFLHVDHTHHDKKNHDDLVCLLPCFLCGQTMFPAMCGVGDFGSNDVYFCGWVIGTLGLLFEIEKFGERVK